VKLVEVVPNFSEGRRVEVVDRIARAVASVPGVHLLDRTGDASHNRSVLTVAGPPDAASEAMERAVGVAIDEIVGHRFPLCVFCFVDDVWLVDPDHVPVSWNLKDI